MAQDEGTANRTLERAAAILDAIGPGAATATELARRTGLSVSTAHRLALSMVTTGFLSRDSNGAFRPGERFMRSSLEHAAAPVIAELNRTTREASQLWIRRGSERICLIALDGLHELRATLPVGFVLPLPEGSSGRLLAEDEDALADVRRQGWVESVGVRTPGIGSVSSPVVVDGTIIAAVCIAIPLARVHVSPGVDHGEAAVAAARRIAEAMSGR